MSRISAEDALVMLAKWSEKRLTIQVVMARAAGQRAVNAAVINEVLPHSRKVLLTLRDENGEDVGVTVSLEGAEWEYQDAGGVLPDFVEIKWACFLAAAFPNGHRYIFGETTPDA
jgi:hypothetical protein